MIIQSDLLGSLEVEPDSVFEFNQGLFGFPAVRSFVLASAERSGLYWLQSAEHSALTFLVVDPFLYFGDYVVDLGDADLKDLGVENPDEVSILAIVTLPSSRNETVTANLQGPLALNMRTHVGKQVVHQEPDYGTRCPFKLEKETVG
jgi:flagellar assembly factor FliW